MNCEITWVILGRSESFLSLCNAWTSSFLSWMYSVHITCAWNQGCHKFQKNIISIQPHIRLQVITNYSQDKNSAWTDQGEGKHLFYTATNTKQPAYYKDWQPQYSLGMHLRGLEGTLQRLLWHESYSKYSIKRINNDNLKNCNHPITESKAKYNKLGS